MNDDTEKHELIVNTGNKGNQFIITVEPNLNSYCNELMKFSKTSETIIVKYKTGFYLRDQ